LGFTGTGRAYPNPTKSIIKLPIMSKCTIGFRDILPDFFAVLSPQRYATNACPNSWKVRAKIRLKIRMIRSWGERLNNKVFFYFIC